MKRRFVGTLLAWLVAVAVVAAIASFAITAAGRQVTSAPVSDSSPIAVPAPADAALVTDSGSFFGVPATGPAPVPQVGARRPVSRVVNTRGGQIQARCAGPDVSLAGGYARPDRGWRAQIRSAQPARLEIVFSHESRRAALVTAVCEDGEPTFRQSSIDPQAPVRAPEGPAGSGSRHPDPGVTEISSPPTLSAEPVAPSATSSHARPPTSSRTATAPPPGGGAIASSSPPVTSSTSATSSASSAGGTGASGAPPAGSATTTPSPGRSRTSSAPAVPATPAVPADGASCASTSGAATVPEGESGCGTAPSGGPGDAGGADGEGSAPVGM